MPWVLILLIKNSIVHNLVIKSNPLNGTLQVPRITEPSKLWDKFFIFLEKHRLRSLRPSNILSIVREDEQQEQPPVIQASFQLHPDNPVKKPESLLLSNSNHLD